MHVLMQSVNRSVHFVWTLKFFRQRATIRGDHWQWWNSHQRREIFLHINEIAPLDPLRNKLNRYIAKVSEDKKVFGRRCTIHNKKCRLVNFHHNFIYYLHVLLEDVSDAIEGEETLASEDDDDDIGEPINLAEEKDLSKQFDIDALKKENTVVSTDEEYALTEEDEVLPTPILPIFPIGDSQYVLLSDIQASFNIREDYCLAIVAQNLQEDNEFLDPELDKYTLLHSNVKDIEFHSAAKALQLIYKDDLNYERILPSVEDFYAMQEKLKITNLGRQEFNVVQVASSSSAVADTSINLWKRNTVVEGENQKVNMSPPILVNFNIYTMTITKMIMTIISLKGGQFLERESHK